MGRRNFRYRIVQRRKDIRMVSLRRQIRRAGIALLSGILISIMSAGGVNAAGMKAPRIQTAESVEKGIIRIEWKADPSAADFQIRMMDLKSGSYTSHSTYDSKGNVETTIQGSAVIPGKTVRLRIRTVRTGKAGEEYSTWSRIFSVKVASKTVPAGGSVAEKDKEEEQSEQQKDSANNRKKKQVIRLLSFPSKITGRKNKIIILKAKAKGKVTFAGNRPDIASVTSDGTLTIHKYGKVRIMIRAGAVSVYQRAVKKKTLVIRPAVCTVSAQKAGAGGIRIHWKRDPLADGYEIQYSFSRTFSGITTRNGYTRSNRVVNTSVSGLGTGKICYVRVRSYVNWKGKRLCGSWKMVQLLL